MPDETQFCRQKPSSEKTATWKGSSNGDADFLRLLLGIIYSSYQSSLNHLWRSVKWSHCIMLLSHFYIPTPSFLSLLHTMHLFLFEYLSPLPCTATYNPPFIPNLHEKILTSINLFCSLYFELKTNVCFFCATVHSLPLSLLKFL